MYPFLYDLGLRTTKAVWPIRGRDIPKIGGLTCEDPRYLQSILPGRIFFIADYYGKLGHGETQVQASLHTCNQDLVQILSGQGIPPPDLRGWASIYESAECRPRHAYEADGDGLQWFLHVVEL